MDEFSEEDYRNMNRMIHFLITPTEKKNETKFYYTFAHLKRRFS